MRGMLSPSLMCADPLNVQQELTVLDDLGVDYIHLDFMDNHFVPNLTLSPELIKATKKVLRHMKRDIHIPAWNLWCFSSAQRFDSLRLRLKDP